MIPVSLSTFTKSIMTKDRIAAALRGAFLADAASMGTHWIYNPAEMAKAVSSLSEPEFKNPPTPSFYSSKEFPGHYGAGQLSPYGEQLLFATDYVASHDDIDGATMSQSLAEWAKTFGGRPDHALTTFLKNMEEGKVWPECGADDSQAHIYMKMVPVVCKFAGSADLKDKVTTAIKAHQNNAMATKFGITSARILEAIILGAPSLSEALETVESNLVQDLGQDEAKEVQEAFEKAKAAAATEQSLSDFLADLSHEIMKDQPESPFYDLAARSCALPGSFIAPLLLMYRNTDYVSGIRENILASGDTCSRGVFLGAVLGAAKGIPTSWMEKLDSSVESQIDSLEQKIVQYSV